MSDQNRTRARRVQLVRTRRLPKVNNAVIEAFLEKAQADMARVGIATHNARLIKSVHNENPALVDAVVTVILGLVDEDDVPPWVAAMVMFNMTYGTLRAQYEVEALERAHNHV